MCQLLSCIVAWMWSLQGGDSADCAPIAPTSCKRVLASESMDLSYFLCTKEVACCRIWCFPVTGSTATVSPLHRMCSQVSDTAPAAGNDDEILFQVTSCMQKSSEKCGEKRRLRVPVAMAICSIYLVLSLTSSWTARALPTAGCEAPTPPQLF